MNHVRKSTSIFTCHLQIAKVPLCLLVAFSGSFGYFLATVQTITPGLFVFLGVLLLAAGAATLNSVQERSADRDMGRTRRRPLAQGVITRHAGLVQAQLLLGAGFFILYAGFSSLGPLLAGMAAVLLYNFLYTPLKHKTVWAIIPGAFCGALPPYIGWLAAEGFYRSPVIIGIIALFIVWQIPHFWLVVLDNQQDYHSSSIPNMLKMMPVHSLRRVSIVWVWSLVSILHIIVLLLVDLPPLGTAVISFGSFFFLIFYTYQLGFGHRLSYRSLFIALNIFMFLVMVILVWGSIEGGL